MVSKVVNVNLNNKTVQAAKIALEMVASGVEHGCVIVGPGGMGKSHLVRATLEDMGIKYVAYGGHISLAAMYEFLCENSEKLIYFDDVSQIVNHREIMELLKQALDPSSYERELHYRSKGVLKVGTPESFIFTGGIIMTFNTIDKKNADVSAVIDRCGFEELKYTRQEIFSAMYQIAQAEGGVLPATEKIIITKEIENWTDSTMVVSLRRQATAFRRYAHFKKTRGVANNEWKESIHRLFGQKKQSWIKELVQNMADKNGLVKRKELVREIAIKKSFNPRTAQRRVAEWIEMEEIYQNKRRDGDVSIKPFRSLLTFFGSDEYLRLAKIAQDHKMDGDEE